MSPAEKSVALKAKARELGFSLVGITGELGRKQHEFYDWWVDQGFGAGMFYLRSQKSRRASIEKILPGAKSVVVCALSYSRSDEAREEPLDSGKIARYAQGEDYHQVLLPKLETLAEFIKTLSSDKIECRSYVDTGPLSERAFAREAGLGWVGKNSLLINRQEGSWIWLGEIVTTADLSFDQPGTDHCGSCRRCIEACPTDAILENLRAVDSQKCISYWNIEHRGPIPTQIAKNMGSWLLGCDICQEVCPWNSHSDKVKQKKTQPEYLPLASLETFTSEEFQKKFAGKALSRPKLSGLQRNSRLIKKNIQSTEKK